METKARAWSLLRPGETGWELWKFRTGGQPVCVKEPSAAAVSAAPRLAVGLPTADMAGLPLWLPANANLRELSELELTSRHLLRRHMEVHCIPVQPGETRSLVLAVASGEVEHGSRYFRKAGRFEANARLWLPHGADVILWKETGVICFAIYRGDKCVFFSTGGPAGASLCGVIRRTLLRLQAEGVLDREPRLIRLYGDFSREECETFEGLGVPLELSVSPPHPCLPNPAADLPPASILTWRAARHRRSRLVGILLIAAVLYTLLLLAAGGETLTKLWKLRSLHAEAALIESEASAARNEILRWRQVRNAVDPQAYALDLLAAVAEQLPGDQIRLTTLSIEPGRIALAGEARDVAQAYQFIDKIRSAPALADFDWNSSQPELAGKQSVRFTMEGRQPDAQTQSE